MQADAVSDPNAVVVHAHHTALTLRAVVRPWRLHRVTDGADFGKLPVHNLEFFIIELKHRAVKGRLFSDDVFALRLRERYLAFR